MAILLGVNAQSTERIRETSPGIVNWVEIGPRSEMAYVHSYGGINLARKWMDEGWLKSLIYGGQPEEAGNQYFDAWWQTFGPVADLIDYSIGPNEVFGSDRPSYGEIKAMHICEMTIWKRFKALRDSDPKYKNIKYGSDSWPPGNIERFQYDIILGLCQQDGVKWHGDAISLHEYWPTANGPWGPDLYGGMAYDRTGLPNLIARFFAYNSLPPVPVIITEAGFDNYQGGVAKQGWTKTYLMENRDAIYAGHWKDYLSLLDGLAALHKVTIIGVTFFVQGRNDEWVRKGFDFTGIWQIEDLIRNWPKTYTDYGSVTPSVPPQPPVPEPTTQVERWLRDFWHRQGVQYNPDNAFCVYALAQATAFGVAIYPMPSVDGNWLNYDDPKYILAYTNPPLYCAKADNIVKPGIPKEPTG